MFLNVWSLHLVAMEKAHEKFPHLTRAPSSLWSAGEDRQVNVLYSLVGLSFLRAWVSPCSQSCSQTTSCGQACTVLFLIECFPLQGLTQRPRQ